MAEKLKPRLLGVKAKPNIIGPDEQVLRDLLNKQDDTTPLNLNLFSDTLPEVKHAPPFRQEPLVIGQPKTAKTVDEILKIAPELRGKSKRILIGPDESAIRILQQEGRSPYSYGNTFLDGTHNRYTGNISVAPNQQDNPDNSEMVNTLVHELSHTRGYDDNSPTDNPSSAYYVANKAPKSLMHVPPHKKSFTERINDLNTELATKMKKKQPIGGSK